MPPLACPTPDAATHLAPPPLLYAQVIKTMKVCHVVRLSGNKLSDGVKAQLKKELADSGKVKALHL